MIWAQSGHFTHSPSGTRLGFSFARVRIGLRSFLNQAIFNSQVSTFKSQPASLNSRKSLYASLNTRSGSNQLIRAVVRIGPELSARLSLEPRDLLNRSFRSWHVILRPRSHDSELFDQLFERLVAGARVELRRFDNEQRRRVVV